MECTDHVVQTEMKKILIVGICALASPLLAETAEEAYARLSSYKSLWETNAIAYYKTVKAINDPAFAVANGMWFVDFLAYPDATEANRLEDVLYAREKVISDGTGSYGVESNTNCWYALADYIARLKDVSDPRWVDERYEVVTGYFDDGVAICANTNPLLNFARYKLEHYEEYKRRHTNLVTKSEVDNAFRRKWSADIRERQRKERELKRAQNHAKQMMRDRFWLFGAKGLSDSEKIVCRSNIVERAHLTPEEEREIFDYVPEWYYKVMGIKRK
jgi:hypothetical protein